jgi:DNA repair exonuclease SbcCD ATPase subunit
MSVEFSNVYQEVLLENLDAILKQNLLFQARLKLLEREANVRAEMQAKIDDLTVNNQKLTEQLDSTQHYKIQAENNDAIVQEKTRIQSALNDSMRELAGVKADLEARRNEISSLNGIVSSREGEIQNLKSSREGEIQNLILDKDGEIQNLKTAKDAEIQNMQSAKDAEIERLKTELFDLQKLVPVVQAAKVVKKTTVKTEEKPVEISATETNKTRVEVGGTF